jgi:hypothetical protein
MARKALVVTQSLAYDGDLHDGESNAEKIDANFTELYEHNSGVIAMSSFAYTGQPSDTETLTIGADVYEFCTAAGSVASDTNIGVVIGGTARATYDNLVAAINASDADNAHATLFQTDDTTPAVANGTEDVLAVAVNGGNTATGTIYLYAADATGGDKVEGAGPDIALSDTATNGGPWRKTHLNLTFGARYDGATKHCHGKHWSRGWPRCTAHQNRNRRNANGLWWVGDGQHLLCPLWNFGCSGVGAIWDNRIYSNSHHTCINTHIR